MKKIFAICLLALLTAGCSTDDSSTFFFEFIPTRAVTNVPDTFVVNKPDTLFVKYLRPSICHGFDGFEVERIGSTREITIITKVIDDQDCTPLTDDEITQPLIFRPEESGIITLSFFKGKDDQGNNAYLSFEIPVLDED